MSSFPQIKSSGRDRLENNRYLRIKACKASCVLTQFSRSALRPCSFFIILELFAILSVKGNFHPPPPGPDVNKYEYNIKGLYPLLKTENFIKWE